MSRDAATPGLEARFELAVGQLALRVALSSVDGPVVLVGPNGSGKTSTLLGLLGIVRPHAGRITLGGRVLFDSAANVDVAPEERGLGYVPQDYGLFTHMTARQNVEFALQAVGVHGRAERSARALDLLQALEVADAAERGPAHLSGGQKQRVALARTLAAEPRALLLDEPLAALDAGARRQVRAFLATHLRRLALPAVVVTHDPEDAAALGTHVVVLESGQIVQTGTMDALREHPATPWIAEFTT